MAPRLGRPKLVPGPPKRFAQGLGLTFSLAAAVCVAVGATTAGWVLVGLLIVAAVLESVFAFCLGCAIFGLLQRAGMIPRVGLRGVRGRLPVARDSRNPPAGRVVGPI